MAKGNFGERLKRERDMREVSMDELSKSTRISSRFLQALENEDWGKLPGGIFGHGFVRSIARYLGLDEEALLSEYDSARAEKLPPPAAIPEERIPSPPKWVPFAALGAVLLLAVGLILTTRYTWHRIAAHRASKQPAVSASISTSPSQPQTNPVVPPPVVPPAVVPPPAAPSEVPANVPLELTITTSAPTRVRVLADDRLLIDRQLPAGETRRFTAKERFDVSASDSSAVLLELNGKAMPPLGAPGASGRMVYTHSNLR
jgi:cytoskeleton protein RodZ